MPLIDDLQAEAYRLGFSLAGVAVPQTPPHFLIYLSWLEAGRHAAMGYLSSERARKLRARPQEIMPSARSILALAARYPDPRQAPPAAGVAASGRVAAYAWGTDYHDVLPARLAALAEFLERAGGRVVGWRGYTDTGPLLERDLAQLAGLGWIGRNTCLISPQHGSYFLLAEMLLDLELETSQPFTTDHCGSCRRCIEACPTHCILPDRTLDARRCISYLTIENKAAIPLELRPLTGDWVFGCDVCQMVCPWNLRFSRPEYDPAFTPRPGVARPLLREEIHLTAAGFNQKFRRSPIQRARRRGYLRNVAVALGNQKDPETAADLALVLAGEAEPLVRGHAAWALGQTGGQTARRALEHARRRENDPMVQEEIEAALALD